ncbi:hypothetical protein [Lacinutrix chionoecetis]
MLTNKQSLYLSGVVIIGFFIAGLFGILNYLIVKIILGGLFLLIIINLIKAKPLQEDIEVVENKREDLF